MQEHTCKNCSDEFVSGHKHRVYCSESCSINGENNKKMSQHNNRWLNPKDKKKTKYSTNERGRMIDRKNIVENI